MTPNHQPSARHTTSRTVMVLAGLTLLAVAASAAALPLQYALDHKADTPAGSIAAQASERGAATCVDAAIPALPALPAIPTLPVPVALPAVPAVQGSSKICAEAGLDGVYASANADAMGAHAGTDADVDTSQQHGAVKSAVNDAKGFFDGLASRITGLF